MILIKSLHILIVLGFIVFLNKPMDSHFAAFGIEMSRSEAISLSDISWKSRMRCHTITAAAGRIATSRYSSEVLRLL